MKEKIQHQILSTLKDAAGYPLAQDVLVLQVRAHCRPVPQDAEIQAQVKHLAGIRFIADLPNELDEENPCWVLDERGQAYVITKRL